MTWTGTDPTEPGLWWIRSHATVLMPYIHRANGTSKHIGLAPHPVVVDLLATGMVVRCALTGDKVVPFNAQWCGPIKPPEDA